MLSRLLTRNEQFVLLAVSGAICVGATVLYMRSGTPMRAVEPKTAVTRSTVVPLRTPTVSDDPRVLENLARVNLPAPPVIDASATEGSAAPDNKPRINVSVMGRVRKPGVYQFDAADRVEDALARAGGIAEDADLTDLNLAATLVDGSTLFVPRSRTAQIVDGKLVIRGGNAHILRNPPEYTLSGWRGPAVVSRAGDGQVGTEPPSLLNVNRASATELTRLPGIGPVLAERIIEYRTTQPFAQVDDLLRVNGIGPKRLETIRPLITVR